YIFEIGIKAYPDKDSIHVGDTIWFEINEPVRLSDINTKEKINYGGAVNLGSAIGFGNYTRSNSVKTAANSFKYILDKGTKVRNPNIEQIRDFRFIQQGNRYLFKLGVIPQDTGVFGVGFSNAQNVYRKDDECTKALFIINFKNTNQHYYLNPNINDNTDLPGGSYFFKVQK